MNDMDDKAITKAIKHKLTVTIEEAGQALGVGRNSAYAAARRGEIEAFKIGARLVVPTAPLRRQLGIDEGRTLSRASKASGKRNSAARWAPRAEGKQGHY